MSEKTMLFLDLDRTLLDFAASERKGLQKTFEAFGMPFREDIIEWYVIHNDKLWGAYEDGLIPKSQIFETRFFDTFSHFGFEVDGLAMEAEYRTHLSDGIDLIEDAMLLVDTLSKTHRLFVTTNGLKMTQEKRLRESGLEPYFEQVFISESMNLQKPMKEYFDACFAQIDGFSREASLVVGDSLASDIQGGINAGIDSCWFNPSAIVNTKDITPTYEIQKLTQLFDILGVTP